MEKYALSGEYIELNKLLTASGLCDTGGIAKYAIANGSATVDGEVENRKGYKIDRGRKSNLMAILLQSIDS